MFKSKRMPIVIPQSEHLRLVGTLAMLWGNLDFDLPPIERNSMIAGMGLHDRGYGLLDNSAIAVWRKLSGTGSPGAASPCTTRMSFLT
jgi:hypothetical protein